MRINEILREANDQGRTAVVGWGRGMGHRGHMLLAAAVIEYAKANGATPFFFVSETVGADDPLLPKEKLAIYRKVFPRNKNIFHTAKSIVPTLAEVQAQGYDALVFIVGADQKNAFRFLQGKTKAGHPVVPYNSVTVLSRQDVAKELDIPELAADGPRATPMRDILKDPDATNEQKFQVWREAMPVALNDDQVIATMKLVAKRLRHPIEAELNEADVPPQGSTFSPLTAATREQPRVDPKIAANKRKAERRMRQFMGHTD